MQKVVGLALAAARCCACVCACVLGCFCRALLRRGPHVGVPLWGRATAGACAIAAACSGCGAGPVDGPLSPAGRPAGWLAGHFPYMHSAQHFVLARRPARRRGGARRRPSFPFSGPAVLECGQHPWLFAPPAYLLSLPVWVAQARPLPRYLPTYSLARRTCDGARHARERRACHVSRSAQRLPWVRFGGC